MATGGPDEETWKRMSPLAQKVYWTAVALLFGLMAAAALYKIFK